MEQRQNFLNAKYFFAFLIIFLVGFLLGILTQSIMSQNNTKVEDEQVSQEIKDPMQENYEEDYSVSTDLFNTYTGSGFSLIYPASSVQVSETEEKLPVFILNNRSSLYVYRDFRFFSGNLLNKLNTLNCDDEVKNSMLNIAKGTLGSEVNSNSISFTRQNNFYYTSCELFGTTSDIDTTSFIFRVGVDDKNNQVMFFSMIIGDRNDTDADISIMKEIISSYQTI